MEGDGAVDDAAAESKGTSEVNINIRCTDGSNKFSVQISLESTVESFREAIAQKWDISPDQRLIYKGRVLRNFHQSLKSYGLKDGHTVDLACRLAPAATTNTTGGTNGSTNSTRSPSLTKDPKNATMMAGSEAIARSSSPNTSPLPNPWTSTRAGRNITGSISRGNAQAPTALRLDPAFIALLMQNPNTSLIRQIILANRKAAILAIRAFSEKRGMPDLSPYLIPLIINPEAFQREGSSQLGQQLSTQESDKAAGVQDPIIPSIPSTMSRGLGTGSPAVPNSNSDEPLEQLYATQLSQLQAMGFSDTQENVRALTATSGDVHEAAKRLSGNSGQ